MLVITTYNVIIIIAVRNRGDGGGPERPHHVKKSQTTFYVNLSPFANNRGHQPATQRT